jgi:hypothetical protein
MRKWCEAALLAFLILNLDQIAVSQMNGTLESRTLSVRIERPFHTVYGYLVDPAHWNAWAFGLGRSLRRSNDGWVADSDGGVVHVRFTPPNDFGIVGARVQQIGQRKWRKVLAHA